MSEPKIVYYDAESDELAGIEKNTIKIDSSFPYVHKNPIWRALSFVVYRVIMKPVAFLWCKLKFSLKIKCKEKLKPFKKQGYFLFSNHTLLAGDAFIPNVINYLKRSYVIVHADNLSTKGTKNFIQMCGAIPVPTEFSGFRPFLNTIKKRVDEGACICIYPEAHVWPYCTFIRDFADTAFSYPIKLDTPVFTSVTTFQKRKLGKTPKVTVYIDGPFMYGKSLPTKVAQKKLRDEVYEVMRERAKLSTYEVIRYLKRGDMSE